MMMASPIAASPAATAMTKTEKTWPVRSPSCLEKATRLMFTALSISSIDIRTVRRFRLTRTPTTPMVKRTNERPTKWARVII